MNFAKKAAAALLAAGLLATTACSGDTTWVYRADGISPPAGVYIINMINAASEAGTRLDEVDHNDPDHVHVDIKYKELLKETLEDQPVAQWIESDAQRQLREYIAVEQKFDEKGLALTDAELANARNSAASTWQTYGEYFEKNGVAQSSMQLQMENVLKSEALFQKLYGEGGEYAVSDQELKDYFSAEYARVEYMLFVKAIMELESEDGEVLSVEEQDELTESQAKAYRSRLAAGEAIEDLIFEQETAEYEGTENEATKPEPGERELILHESQKNTYYSEELVEGALALKVGDAEVVEDENFYYVLRRLDILEDPEAFDNYKSELLSSLKKEEYDELVAAWAGELNMEVNQEALNAYKASKLKID